VAAYRPVFSDAAVAFFVSVPKTRQRVLLDRSRELAADPFLRPDFQSADGEGRQICHLLVDDFIFDYWVDHAIRAVMITEIEDAG
jgi:hypothetical protein